LQSSLNADEGLGTASLGVIYGTIILSSMFLPPILIKNLGCKWTIVVSMGCYVAYSLGNLYSSWETLIPTSIILGLGGAPLWSTKCTYLTISGNMQGKKENKEGRDIINQYFGIFFLIFQSSAVWGNLMSSLIFELADDRASITAEQLEHCGAVDCPVTNVTGNSTIDIPPDSLRYTLVGSYIGLLHKNCVITWCTGLTPPRKQAYRWERLLWLSSFALCAVLCFVQHLYFLVVHSLNAEHQQALSFTKTPPLCVSYVLVPVSASVQNIKKICPIRTSVYQPQTDGLVEHFNKTLKQMLRRFVNQEQKHWALLLPYLLFAVREVLQSWTGFSPFELLYGRQPHGIRDLLRKEWEEHKVSSKNVVQQESAWIWSVVWPRTTSNRLSTNTIKHQYTSITIKITIKKNSNFLTRRQNLNLIELVWDELDRRVKAKLPTSALHLWELLQKSWEDMSGTVTNLSCIIGLFLWKPHPDDLAVFFVFSGLWGMADAVWQTQTNALYGVLFEEHKEAAFANYKLWESVGFVIAFGYSNYLCVDVKLYVVLAVLVVGMVLYGCVEYIEYKNPTACTENELEVEKKPSIAQSIL
ncbi:UN93A protein, partial [Polyodon spathula]|nr:UN93A protein [Polyodon spathula]